MARRREILGVVLMALTASTVFTLFIAVERADKPIEILENTFPPALRHDLRNTFSLGIIARKPMKLLEIEVSYLSLLNPEGFEENITDQGREGMLSLDSVSYLNRMSQALGKEPSEYELEGIKRGQGEFGVYVFDFTDLLQPFVQEAVLEGHSGTGLTTIFAGMYNESGLMLLYGGSRDFFPRRNITITELSVSLNDEKDVYKRIKELSPSEIASGVPTLLDAPGGGRLTFSDLEKDDTVRLAFSVDRSTIRGTDVSLGIAHGNKLGLVKVLSDLQVEEFMANWVVAG